MIIPIPLGYKQYNKSVRQLDTYVYIRDALSA